MNRPAEPDGYDDVRRALHERGYLETPLERLFLGGLGDPLGRSFSRRLVSALLAGAIAGPLLAALLAGVLVLESRGLVPLWPDGVLYAILFALVLGLLVALLEAGAGGLIRTVGRVHPGLSPRKASLAAGLIVASALSLYLGLWWVKGGGQASLRDLAGLFVLALGAGFAGRVVSAAALVQAALATGRAPRRARPRFAALAVGAALSVAALAALVASAGLRDRSGRGGEPVALAPGAPPRALLVAWDGLSWELASGIRRVETGSPPRFLEAVTHAAAFVDGGTGWDPVAGWTTVATGCAPEVHGVRGLELRALRGAAAPVPRGGLAAGPLEILTRLWPTEQRVVRAGVRQVPAFWEVTAAARKTAVVRWWGTWPAAAPGAKGGYVVSDGALVALKRGRGAAEAIYPPAWGASRGPRWLGAAERAALTADGSETPVARIRGEALLEDLFQIEALPDALHDPEVGAATIYLPGLDILRERARRLGLDPFGTLDAVRAHVLAIDRQLAALALEPTLAGAQVWIVGLPGRAAPGERGFVGARPGGVSPGTTPPGEAVHELTGIAPAWLAAAGYPVDARMRGNPLPLTPQPPVRRVRTNAAVAAVATGPEAGAGLEADVVERLRSLGYVK